MRKLTLASAAAVAALGLATIAAPTGVQAEETTPVLAAVTSEYDGDFYLLDNFAETVSFDDGGYVALEKKSGDPKIADFFEVTSGEKVDFSSLSCTADTAIYYCSNTDYDAAVKANEKTVAASKCKVITLKAGAKKAAVTLNYASFNSGDKMVKDVTDGKKGSSTMLKDNAGVMYKIGEKGTWCDAKDATVSKLKTASKTGSTIYFAYVPKTADLTKNEITRVAKITKVKAAKQGKAPTVKQDGVKGTLAIKTGMSYSLTGNETNWTDVGTVNSKKVTALSVYSVTNTSTGAAIASGTAVYVCTKGTEKKPATKVTKLFVGSAKGATGFKATLDLAGEPKDLATKGSVGIKVAAVGTVEAGGYECILVDTAKVNEYFNGTVDITDTKACKWTAVKADKAITYKSLKVAKYDDLKTKTLLVREKGYTNKTTKVVSMPGKIFKIDFTGGVKTEAYAAE